MNKFTCDVIVCVLSHCELVFFCVCVNTGGTTEYLIHPLPKVMADIFQTQK